MQAKLPLDRPIRPLIGEMFPPAAKGLGSASPAATLKT
jgi:hypothetical protein